MKTFWTITMAAMLIWVIYLLNPRAWADEPPVSKGTTKELMGKFLTHMEALKGFMVSEDKFSDPKNFTEIDSHLKELTKLSKQAAHDPRLQLPGYRVSRKVLEDHISETERVFRLGNKPYSRWMLNSTLSVCMSCHTQVPTVSRQLKTFENLSPFIQPFDQAEFLFATRAFDQAKGIYDKVIQTYPESKINSQQLETALERTITYYARIQRAPAGALKALEQYQHNENLPPFIKDDVTSWIKAVKDWKNEDALDPTKATDSQIVGYAKKNLDPKVAGYVMASDDARAAQYLKVSGILYEYLQLHPTSGATPEILYWLAICDKGLNNNFFYSLGDIYLRECIVRFPQSSIAKQCYEEYEAETTLNYSGSSGIHLPLDVIKDLKLLKSLINAPPTSMGEKL